MSDKVIRTSFCITEPELEKLKQFARVLDRSVGWVVRQAVAQYVQHYMNDIADVATASGADLDALMASGQTRPIVTDRDEAGEFQRSMTD
jgi:hypothetical protein